MRAIRPTLVVVVGVFVCAVHAVPARAQPQDGWDMALTGGFVASGLVDPVFALGNRQRSADTRRRARARSGKHSQSRRRDVRPDLQRSLAVGGADLDGIGIRGDSRATLFMGSALRLGRHASVTGGVAIGPVSALPAGTVEGRAIADTNVLSNLITRTTHSWFAGVTYTFASLR
jgi:hypothetical protein